MTKTVEKLVKELEKEKLSIEDRTALTTAILSRLMVLPLADSFVVGGGNVSINGKQMDTEQVIVFRDSCIALKDNFARQIIQQQVRYLATNLGIYKSVSTDELFFSKAALWCIEQEEKLLDKIV